MRAANPHAVLSREPPARSPSDANERARDEHHVLTPQMVDRFEEVLPFEHRALVFAPGTSKVFEGSSFFRHLGGGIA